MSAQSTERLEFLLAMRATDIVTDDEAREIDGLLEAQPSFDADGYDLVAAALLADAIEVEPMPSALRDRLIAEGLRLVPPASSKTP